MCINDTALWLFVLISFAFDMEVVALSGQTSSVEQERRTTMGARMSGIVWSGLAVTLGQGTRCRWRSNAERMQYRVEQRAKRFERESRMARTSFSACNGCQTQNSQIDMQ